MPGYSSEPTRLGPLVVVALVMGTLGFGAGWFLAPKAEPIEPVEVATPEAVEALTPPPPGRAEAEPDTVSDPQTEEELLACEGREVSLRRELSGIAVEYQTARADAERYKAGVDRCVAELNRLSRAAGEAILSSGSLRGQPRTGSRRLSVSSISGPYIGRENRSLVARGKLYNAGQETQRVQMTIRAIDDRGQTIETGRQRLTLEPRAERTWQHRFRAPPIDGVVYDVQVGFELQ